jgi:paraquat-inducible protein B
VVASRAILIVTLVVVGAGKMFRRPTRFVCMLTGNLNELKVGAPVKVRGVQIGSVSAIRLSLSPSEGQLRPGVKEFRLPVIIELDKSQLTARGASGEALGGAGFQDMIKRGLRAQLNVESLLTGLLYVDLDLHPNAPANFVLEPGGPYPEVPTIPTDLAEVQERLTKVLEALEKVDFQALIGSITDAANSIKSLTSSPELKVTLESLKEAVANLNQTAISVRGAVDNANSKIGPLVSNLQANSKEVNKTLDDTRTVLVNLQQTLDPNSPLAVRLNETLDQLTETSRSIGEFTDYLERNPSALVRGRYVPDKDRQ